jgi:beta-lactam-binding protein with PASTA domain
VTVPDVVGKTKAEAATILGQVNLAMNPTQEQSQEPKGIVIRQQPSAGASAKQGDTVTVYVSGGPPPTTYVRVPDVVGRSQSKATATLDAAGFAVRVRTGSSSRPVGEVYDQSPAGGDDAPKGSTVTIAVSTGPKQVSVPDVTGRTAAKAASMLESAGLVVDQVEQPEGSVPAGTVFMQDPSGGSSVKAGSTVKIIVAQPAPTTTTTTGTTTTGSSTTSPPST